MRATHWTLRVLPLIAFVCLTGCNNRNGGDDQGSAQLSGTLAMGPLSGATIEVYELLDTGGRGPLLGTAMSNASGAFQLPITGYVGMTLVRATGGTTINPATGLPESVPTDQPLFGFAEIVNGTGTVVQASPLTSLAMPLLVALCQQPEARARDQVENALRMVGLFFGVSLLDGVAPADLTAGPVPAGPAADHGAAIAALSQRASELQLDTMTYVTRVGQDLQDLRGDGARFTVPMSTDALPSNLTDGLQTALETFLTTGRGAPSGIVANTTAPWQAFDANPLARVEAPDVIYAIENAYGDVRAPVTARIFIAPTSAPVGPADGNGRQVRIESQVLPVTVISATELGVEIPTNLTETLNDLILESPATGLKSVAIRGIAVGDSQATPVVRGIHPNRVPLAGGAVIEVIGENLYPTTEIRIGNLLVPHLECHAPGKIVVIAPPGPEALVGIEVRNPVGGPIFVPDALSYVSKNVPAAAPIPSTTAPLKLNVSKLFDDPLLGPTLSTFRANMIPSNADQGTFQLDEATLGLNSSGVTIGQRSGTSFTGNELLRRSVLLFDSQNQRSDFLRVDADPSTQLLSGAAGNGIAFGWPRPVGMSLSDIIGRYAVNQVFIDQGTNDVGQAYGWLEFDDQGFGSMNLLEYRRPWSGGPFAVQYVQDSFTGQITSEGDFIAESHSTPGTFYRGGFDGTGSLGYLNYRQPNCLGSFTLGKMEFGQKSRGFGNYEGALFRQSLGSAGSTLIHRNFQQLTETEPDGQSLTLSLEQTTKTSSLFPDGRFGERVEFRSQFVSPAGIVRSETGEVRGFTNEATGTWLHTGRSLSTFGFDAESDRSFSLGVSGKSPMHFSLYSFFGNYAFMESTRASTGQPISGGTPSFQSTIRQRYELIDADPNIHGQWNGRTFNLSGTIPSWSASLAVGHEKTISRDVNGNASSFLSVPQTFGGVVLYAGFGDKLHMIATESTEPLGRLASVTEFPEIIGSIKFSADGELATGAEPAGADSGSEFAFIRRGAVTSVPSGTHSFGFLSQEYSSGAPSDTSFRVGQGTLQFGMGGTTTTDIDWIEYLATGNTQQGNVQQPGNVGLGGLGEVDWTLPALELGQSSRTFRGQMTPSGDFGIGYDFTPGSLNTGRLNLIQPSSTQNPFGCSFQMSGTSLDFLSTTTFPATERFRSNSINFAPNLGQTNYLGEIRTRTNHLPTVVGQAQFLSTQLNSTGSGRGTISFQQGLPALNFVLSNRNRSMATSSLVILITPTLIAGSEE